MFPKSPVNISDQADSKIKFYLNKTTSTTYRYRRQSHRSRLSFLASINIIVGMVNRLQRCRKGRSFSVQLVGGEGEGWRVVEGCDGNKGGRAKSPKSRGNSSIVLSQQSELPGRRNKKNNRPGSRPRRPQPNTSPGPGLGPGDRAQATYEIGCLPAPGAKEQKTLYCPHRFLSR